jgi:biotin carboxyl carrier protein
MTTYRVTVAGIDHVIEVDPSGPKSIDGLDAAAVKTVDTGGHRYSVRAHGEAIHLAAVRNGHGYQVMSGGIALQVTVQNARVSRGMQPEGGTTQGRNAEIRAPMPALVKSVSVQAGDRITKGQMLIVLEAMKMENDVRASRDATVQEIAVAPGMTVEKDQLLVKLD